MTQQYTLNEAKNYLATLGNVKLFYISQLGDESTSLIYYVREDNSAWVFMDDNDELVSTCVKYLKSRGTPVLTTVEELKSFEDQLKGKN